jgi:hypothetical protein
MADRFVLMREGAVSRRVEKSGLSMEQLRALYTRYAENGEEEPRG